MGPPISSWARPAAFRRTGWNFGAARCAHPRDPCWRRCRASSGASGWTCRPSWGWWGRWTGPGRSGCHWELPEVKVNKKTLRKKVCKRKRKMKIPQSRLIALWSVRWPSTPPSPEKRRNITVKCRGWLIDWLNKEKNEAETFYFFNKIQIIKANDPCDMFWFFERLITCLVCLKKRNWYEGFSTNLEMAFLMSVNQSINEPINLSNQIDQLINQSINRSIELSDPYQQALKALTCKTRLRSFFQTWFGVASMIIWCPLNMTPLRLDTASWTACASRNSQYAMPICRLYLSTTTQRFSTRPIWENIRRKSSSDVSSARFFTEKLNRKAIN